jgi:hypothetical protein
VPEACVQTSSSCHQELLKYKSSLVSFSLTSTLLKALLSEAEPENVPGCVLRTALSLKEVTLLIGFWVSAQLPDEQVKPALQVLPQAPQLLLSDCRFRHPPPLSPSPHQFRPEAQNLHEPAAQYLSVSVVYEPEGS